MLKKTVARWESNRDSPDSKRNVLPVTPWNVSLVNKLRDSNGNASRARKNSFVTLGIRPTTTTPGMSRHAHNMSRSQFVTLLMEPSPSVTRDIFYGRSLTEAIKRNPALQ